MFEVLTTAVERCGWEVAFDVDDWYGSAVHLAARLCDAAELSTQRWQPLSFGSPP